MGKANVVKANVEKYEADKYLPIAERSGASLKVSTVKAAGAYPIHILRKNGTSTVMTALFALAIGGKKTESVPAAKMAEALEKVKTPGTHEGKVLSHFIKHYEKEKGVSFGNLDNLLGLISGDIRRGGAVRYVAVEDEDGALDKAMKMASAVK